MMSFGRRIEALPPPETALPPRPAPAVATASPPRPALVAAAAPHDAALLLRLRSKIMEQLDSGAVAEMRPEVLRAELEPVIHDIADKEHVQLSARDQAQLAQELTDDMVGFGPLEPLLRNDSISDIMVNGPDTVFIEIAGKLQRSTVRFRDAEHVAMVAQKMVGDDRPARRRNRARSATRAFPMAAAST